MNRTKMGLVLLIGVFLTTGFFAVSNAAADRGGHGGFGGPLFGLLHRLDLTDAQKTIVAGVLKPYVAQLQTDVTTLATDRATLIKDILGQAGATQIAGDATNVANAEGALTQLRATIFSAIISGLSSTFTPAQQKTITNIESKIGTKTTTRVDEEFAELNQWIASH